jgi:ribulose-bisphosphate carboxylase large chain
MREISEHQSSPETASGERFRVTYRLEGDENEALARAKDICLEQTVEFPDDLVPEGFIRDSVLGKIESFEKGPDGYIAVISFPAETAAGEFTQLLNVIFGNISIKPGIFVRDLDLSPSLYKIFKGPRFGVSGLREHLGVASRPLLATALKPMGLTSEGLASLAYKFALGGIDLIKDDHGLTDQPYAPFRERVARCAEAVELANRETGMRCLYVANVTAPSGEIMERAAIAKDAGAGGLLIAPGITGLDAMKRLAGNYTIALPVISHPAFQGSLVMGGNGMSHSFLFGKLARLAGADASIYPNYGGRFSFSREECRSIAEGCAAPMGSIAPIFPAPGGGMTMENIPDMASLYGRDVIYLVGGGLFRHGDDLVENCRYFRRLIDA